MVAVGPRIKPCYKRLETDMEYRKRLYQRTPSWGPRILASYGKDLDEIGDYFNLPRRIIEVCDP